MIIYPFWQKQIRLKMWIRFIRDRCWTSHQSRIDENQNAVYTCINGLFEMFLWNVLKILEGAIKADLDNRKEWANGKTSIQF